MLVDKKIIGKLESIEKRYAELRFEKLEEIEAEMCETYEHFTKEPDKEEGVEWRRVVPGTKWGDNWLTAWFRGSIKLPESCSGKKVFIRAKTNGETLFIVNGSFKGVFDNNHPVVMMDSEGKAGELYHVALEAYSGHHIPGCGPDENNPAPEPGCKVFEGIEVVLEREDVSGFVFDLKVLIQLAKSLDENNLRRNKIIKELVKVYEVIDAMPSETTEESWRLKLKTAREIMKKLLDMRNSSTVPKFGIIGHSHIDSAWLWPISETWRKCARTFSSVLNLMEQYPEFKFIQSAPCHTYEVRRRYPEIYQRIKKKVSDGAWEPNGAMWIEPDCNIPSGESFVRQLLVGQNTTREMFGYTSDTLWLPDVFGYSAALPQILKGAGVNYFCTTKLSWNDTTRFPYDTFIWKGIDGTSVISHFNTIHCWPDPETLTEQWSQVQHKDIQDRRLTAIGYGDGGGGPMAEMIEVSKRVEDLEGCPRASYTTVSSFMKGIENELEDLPEWHGELYLELHRGTLTSIAKVKRGNRKTEIAYRDAEFLNTLAALKGEIYPKNTIDEMWRNLLLNQFHDILPGSSIARVNDEAIEAFESCIKKAKELSNNALAVLSTPAKEGKVCVMAVNSLGWKRNSELSVSDLPEGYYPEDQNIKSQWIENVEGSSKLLISNISIPAFGWKVIPMVQSEKHTDSSFCISEEKLETPYAIVKFDSIGRIISFVDKNSGREIVKKDGALNTFWLGEDVPNFWDNWDIDKDQRLKMQVERGLVERKIISNGPLQLRIRSLYNIGAKSMLMQDMVFHSDSPRVDFETKIDWHEKHRLLKAGFELEVFADNARHEIQYGYVERPVHENLPQDRARFESCNHKWTDISESEFGVAILNDCKYGIGVRGSDVRLSLLKSGTRPDVRGDEGVHLFTYSMLPHNCSFSVDSVVKPAYELNIPVISKCVGADTPDFDGLLSVDAPNIIVESIKWAENGQGFIVRLYEASKTGKQVNIKFNVPIKSAAETNLLEEKIKELKTEENTVSLYMKPFEIKTLWCKCL